MDASVYAVIAYIARYWFALLAVLIIWRAIRWLRQDIHRTARAQRTLPDAGYIGDWAVVASDAPRIQSGLILRAPRDGWIGSARACDVRLLHAGVPARAARFYLREDGLHVLPQRRGIVMVDGEPVQKEAVLRHGATLTAGGVTLQLRLFAGVLLSGETLTGSGRLRRKRPQPQPVVEEIYMPDEEEEDDGEDLYEDVPYIEEDNIEYVAEDGQDDEADASSPPMLRPALTVRRRPGRHR